MELGLSERWILLADVTDSTQFFWELTQAGVVKPNALFEASGIYSGNMESIFNMMANLPQGRLVVQLGNTMGDGFILVGRHGHGTIHIAQDAPKVLLLAKLVKEQCDRFLSKVRQSIIGVLEHHQTPRTLPELRMKVTLHHGYLVTMMCSQRFFGDTVNYCSRVASAAFKGWNEGIVLTGKFVDVLPQPLQPKVRAHQCKIEMYYPKKQKQEDLAYRINLSQSDIWSEVEQLATCTANTKPVMP